MTDHVTIGREGGVLHIRFNRPEKKNALTGAMYDAMSDALDRAAGDEAVGAALFSGAGGVFTAGNDLADFLAVATRKGATLGQMPAGRFIETIARTELPLVAAIEGVAVGVGATMTLHCDLVYAAPTARFRMPFVDLGLVPEAGSSLLLPQRVGTAKAAEILMLGEPYDAAEALRLGLVNAVVPAEDLVAHATARAQALAAKPRQALRTTRRLLRAARAEALPAAMRAEGAAFGAALASAEARAAFEAFLNRPKVA